MQKIIHIICLNVLLYTCLTNQKLDDDEVRRISVLTKIPDNIVNGHGVFIEIKFYISYFKQYIIYELPYHKTYDINNKMIYDSVKYEYFVCNSDNNLGYLIKNLTDSFEKKIIWDSTLKSRAYGGSIDSFNFREIKIKTINKLNHSAALIYRYIFDNYFYDSAYFHYDPRLKGIKFSIDKKLDSINNSKLVKAELFLKHDSLTKIDNIKEFYISSIELSEISGPELKQIKFLFDRFIKDEKKKK